MKVFWRAQPLSDREQNLLEDCMQAHADTATRNNASSGGLINAAQASRNYVQSIAAAMMTLGSVHAPVPQAHALLGFENPGAVARAILDGKKRVPGWGNAFHKDGPDPAWKWVRVHLEESFPELHRRIESVTAELHDHGKRVYPNAACYTAATALALGLPAEASIYLVLAGRLNTWSAIFLSTINNHPAT